MLAVAGHVQQAAFAPEWTFAEVKWWLLGMVAVSVVFGWAATEFMKRWRADHHRRPLLPSGSYARAAGLTFIAWLGCWYLAHAYGVLNIHDWFAGIIAGVLLGGMSPALWNPLLALIRKYAPTVADAIEKVGNRP